MSITIFCTFDHQDMADLAMGHIRRVAGVKTIHYIYDRNTRGDHDTASGVGNNLGMFGIANAVGANTSGGLGWGFVAADTDAARPTAPHPVTVKITCSDAAKNPIVSRLVNQHASHIIVAPR